MRAVTGFLGVAGAVLVVFGLLPYGLTGAFDLWAAVHLTGGGILLALSVALNFAGLRRTLSSRGARERLRAAAGTALFVGILVGVNVLAARHPLRFDATERRIHTLSESSRTLVRSLDEPVELLAFLSLRDPERDSVGSWLGRFASESPLLSWRFVDPVQEPEEAVRLGVRDEGVLVAARGGVTARARIEPSPGITEGVVTNLLLQVSRTGPREIRFLTGHGEGAFDDLETPEGLGMLAAELGDAGFASRPLLLSAEPEIPEDIALVIVAGPEKPLLEHELDRLAAYVEGGGRALVLLEPGRDAGLTAWLERSGVVAGDDMVVDREVVPFLGPRLGIAPLIEDFPDHPVTRGFRERIVLDGCRSIRPAPERAEPGTEVRAIARTREAAWAERDWTGMFDSGRAVRDPDDPEGPVPVAVAMRRTADDGDRESRLVVVGDASVASNRGLGAFFNREFVLRSVEWLAGNEARIAEAPRGLRPSRLDMTRADYVNLFRLSVLLVPEALLILGLTVWWRRRSL